MNKEQEKTLEVMLQGCYTYKVAYRDDTSVYLTKNGTTTGKNPCRINESGSVTPLDFSTIQRAKVA